MSAALPTPGDCCSTCDDVTSVQVPGPAGGDGTDGSNGANGSNAFTALTAQFIMPAVSSTVTVAVGSSAWMTPGQIVFVQNGGYFSVSSKPNALSAILSNLGYTGNVSPTTVVANSSQVSPGGVVGATGSTGATGGTGATGVAGTEQAVGQTAHGFAVGDVLRVNTSGAYTKAKADADANGKPVIVVKTVVDANNFIGASCGVVTGMSGITVGTLYYLSAATAGALTSTKPSAPTHLIIQCAIGLTSTSIYFNQPESRQVGADVPVGTILDFAGTANPDGYLTCDGGLQNITDYPELYAVVGTLWGALVAAQFRIPDLRSKFTAGSGGTPLTNAGASIANTVGTAGGANTFAIGNVNVPYHDHWFGAHTDQIVDDPDPGNDVWISTSIIPAVTGTQATNYGIGTAYAASLAGSPVSGMPINDRLHTSIGGPWNGSKYVGFNVIGDTSSGSGPQVVEFPISVVDMITLGNNWYAGTGTALDHTPPVAIVKKIIRAR